MSNRTKQKVSSPPTPQLQPGHFLNNQIEISNLLMTDCQKNVYSGIIDYENVIILEQNIKKDDSYKIPKECKRFFPECLNSFNTKEREYIVFRCVNVQPLSSAQLRCWEPYLMKLVYNMMISFAMIDKYQMKTSDITLKDIYFEKTKIQFLIFPNQKDKKHNFGGVFKNILKELFYKKIHPNLTRDLNNPLASLCLSKKFETIINGFIEDQVSIKKFSYKLKQMVEDKHPNWLISSKTDVGEIREHNEDSCGWQSTVQSTYNNQIKYHALAVSDGMGGHQKGEIASHFSLSYWFHNISKRFDEIKEKEYTNPILAEIMGKAFDHTSKKILESDEFRKISSDTRPGATLVAAIVVERLAVIGNCGDSRAYIIKQDSIKRITKDHSIVQLYIDRGEITEEEAQNHEKSNYITTFMGIEPKNYKKDIYIQHIPKGGSLLLCSDGLTGMLSDQEIFDLVSSAVTTIEAVNNLIKAAKKKGGEDNISVIVMQDIIL